MQRKIKQFCLVFSKREVSKVTGYDPENQGFIFGRLLYLLIR